MEELVRSMMTVELADDIECTEKEVRYLWRTFDPYLQAKGRAGGF